jgi:hypothetical protein
MREHGVNCRKRAQPCFGGITCGLSGAILFHLAFIVASQTAQKKGGGTFATALYLALANSAGRYLSRDDVPAASVGVDVGSIVAVAVVSIVDVAVTSTVAVGSEVLVAVADACKPLS